MAIRATRIRALRVINSKNSRVIASRANIEAINIATAVRAIALEFYDFLLDVIGYREKNRRKKNA